MHAFIAQLASIAPVIVIEDFSKIFPKMIGANIRLDLGPAIKNKMIACLYFYQNDYSFFSSSSKWFSFIFIYYWSTLN
jgi:hypothetical protein